MNIKKDTPINQIISAYPQTIKFFNDLHMSCGSCFAVSFDTLENGALMHSMDVDKLVLQLDQFVHSSPAKITPISAAETNSPK
jgi:hybrid cluster-associated redox disulfide protein